MSYRALYRKYRPRFFADIVGQPGIVQALTGQVDSGRISHAYLFSGPRGTGKTSAAKVLARAINCMDNHHGEACGVCRACTELAGETNMDVIEIDAASNNSVDKVREMLENVKYMPAVGKFRVYIVDEVHMLSASAFNALLKTLEEPPAHVVFILATTEPHRLPPTVLSRCQKFQFRRVSTEAMTGLLQGVLKAEGASADREALQAIARASDGGMRDALSLLDQCLSLDGTAVTAQKVLEMLGTSDSAYYFSVAESLLGGDAGTAVDRLDSFISTGGDIKTFATDLCRHMRDLFIASYVKDASSILEVSADEAARLSAQAARFAPGAMLKCLGILSELEGGLRYAANPRVLVELAIFRSCRVEKEASYEALLARVERLEAQMEGGGAPIATARPAPVQSAPASTVKMTATPPPQAKAPTEAKKAAEDSAKMELPWFETEEQPQAKAIPQSAPLPTAFEEPVPLFDEKWDDVAEAPPDDLPGQMDLFVMEKEVPPVQSKPEPRPEPRHEPKPDSPAHQPNTQQPARLWKTVLDKLPPPLLALAGKGKATAFDGTTLTVTFTEDEKGAANMLEEDKRKARLSAIVASVAGSAVVLKLEITQWSPAQQQFIERSRALIPKDATIIIEKD